MWPWLQALAAWPRSATLLPAAYRSSGPALRPSAPTCVLRRTLRLQVHPAQVAAVRRARRQAVAAGTGRATTESCSRPALQVPFWFVDTVASSIMQQPHMPPAGSALFGTPSCSHPKLLTAGGHEALRRLAPNPTSSAAQPRQHTGDSPAGGDPGAGWVAGFKACQDPSCH